MRATIIPAAQRDRMEDLELLAELIAQALELPADTPIKRLAVEASVAIRMWKAEEAVAEFHAAKADALEAGMSGRGA